MGTCTHMWASQEVPLTSPIFCLIMGLILRRKMITCTQMWGFVGGAVNGTYFQSHFGSDCYEQIGNMYADLGHHGGCRLTAPHFFSHFVSNCYEQNGNMYADLGHPRGCRKRHPICCLILDFIVLSKMTICTSIWGIPGDTVNDTHLLSHLGLIVLSKMTICTQMWGITGCAVHGNPFVFTFWV